MRFIFEAGYCRPEKRIGKTFLKKKRVERHYETKSKSLKYNKTC